VTRNSYIRPVLKPKNQEAEARRSAILSLLLTVYHHLTASRGRD